MEGPHGSGGATPETTVSWLWGYAFGMFTLAVFWGSLSYFTTLPAIAIAVVALMVVGIGTLFFTEFL